MKYTLLLLLGLSIGCTTHNSKIKTFKLDIEAYETPVEQVGCGWTIVDETYKTKIFGLKVSSTPRQYNKSLYYCCPGKTDPEPICYQTQWVSK